MEQASIFSKGLKACRLLRPQRVVAKFLFKVSDAQWVTLSAALVKPTLISRGHVLCGSTIALQRYVGPGASTTTMISVPQVVLSPTATPDLLGAPAAASGLCYTSL